MTRPRLDVEKSNARRNTFGNAISSRERGESASKKITVGRDILTVPRRKSVSHAVVVATTSERTEIVNAIGSDIELSATAAVIYPYRKRFVHPTGWQVYSEIQHFLNVGLF